MPLSTIQTALTQGRNVLATFYLYIGAFKLRSSTAYFHRHTMVNKYTHPLPALDTKVYQINGNALNERSNQLVTT
jgi:hypothetical protein